MSWSLETIFFSYNFIFLGLPLRLFPGCSRGIDCIKRYINIIETGKTRLLFVNLGIRSLNYYILGAPDER